MEDLVCCDCGYKWAMEPDEDGLFDGYGCPPCPKCFSGRGVSASNYVDFECIICGNQFRKYGNGGLRLGMIPPCPKCGGSCNEI